MCPAEELKNPQHRWHGAEGAGMWLFAGGFVYFLFVLSKIDEIFPYTVRKRSE
jgi:hypothetical protein